MKRFLVCFLPLVFAQSCTSIDQPVASAPLVVANPSFMEKKVPADLSTRLNSLSVGDKLFDNDVLLSNGSLYHSALGLKCIKLSSESKSGFRVACLEKSGQTWFYTQPVLSGLGEGIAQ